MSAPIVCLSITKSTAPSNFRILPAGVFRSNDGRPATLPGWRMDAQIAGQLMAAIHAQANDLVIDYEHQSTQAPSNGQPAPAAGWFKRLEWREGDGLYVTDARWTEKARTMIEAGEYRYLSPVFAFDPNTGAVTRLVSVALTNTPALNGLADLCQPTASLSRQAIGGSQPEPFAGDSKGRATFVHCFGEQMLAEARASLSSQPVMGDDEGYYEAYAGTAPGPDTFEGIVRELARQSKMQYMPAGLVASAWPTIATTHRCFKHSSFCFIGFAVHYLT